MTSSCCCNCFSSSKRHQLSLEPEEEPNAFDLTWRNYLLPSSSCCCIPNIFKRKHQPIRLGDDDDDMIDDELFISPHQHFDRQNINNHNQYHGRAVRGYLDDPRDWEFDSMFTEGEFPAGVVTRNPFGRKNSKKKRKHKKHHPRVIQQQDDEEIFSEEIQDAEFLGDDQIAHLAYERSKNMDPYGEEGYIDSTYDRPISQEMQPPPAQKEFYAPRTMPSYYFVDQDNDNEGYYDDDQQQQYYENNKQSVVVQDDEYYQQQQQQEQQEQQQYEASSSTAPVVTTVAEQAQDLLSERLEDLTDKLIYIRQNMMDLNNKKEKEPDNTTLRTLNKNKNKSNNNNNDTDENDNDSIKKGADSDKTASDMDSIASEALNEYERPDDDDDEEEHDRRRRSAASQYKFPFGGGDTPPFGSDHHPFSYFTEQNSKHKKHHVSSSSIASSSYSRRHSALVDDDNNTPGLTIRGVLDFGKKWFGS